MERSPSLQSTSATLVVPGGGGSRRTSRIEDVPKILEVPEEESALDEGGPPEGEDIVPSAPPHQDDLREEEKEHGDDNDDEDEYLDPKSRYFSPINIFCIIASLLISAFFIFEPQLVSMFWKVFSPEETPEFLLNLKTCKVPSLYDGQSELPFMWEVDVSLTKDLADIDLKCEQVDQFSNVVDDSKLVLLSKLKKRRCCIRDITRPDVMVSDMYSVSYACPDIGNMSDISGKEFILVQCSSSRNKSVDFNTHALLPIKPTVQEKLDYWISAFNTNGNSFENGGERPFSVAVIVLSSTSRAHAYRSLPDTMSLLERKSGFTVMNGYNILEDSNTNLSYANMIPLLTGTVGQEDSNWITYWNNATKLISDFESQKFVTMYMDESRKLLRSSHGDPHKLNRYRSFLRQPTDYYMKPFLEAHKEATEALFLNRMTSKHYCFGKTTSTAYLLRHLLKFHKKFSSVPAFSFSYFDWPQAQYGLEAISKMDKTYFDFFKEFLKTPHVLERTAVVVMSDIGSLNHPYFKTEHGMLEKINPLLMIRLPDNLVSKNPTLRENLKANSHRLVSPIDVHKTISIFSKIGVPKTFIPENVIIPQNDDDTKDKRISGRNLFVSELPVDRNCSQAYIPEHLCPCGRLAPSNYNGRTILNNDGKPEKYWRYHMLPQ